MINWFLYTKIIDKLDQQTNSIHHCNEDWYCNFIVYIDNWKICFYYCLCKRREERQIRWTCAVLDLISKDVGWLSGNCRYLIKFKIYIDQSIYHHHSINQASISIFSPLLAFSWSFRKFSISSSENNLNLSSPFPTIPISILDALISPSSLADFFSAEMLWRIN